MLMAILFSALLLAGAAAVLRRDGDLDDRDRHRWWPGAR